MQLAKSKYWYAVKKLIPASVFDPILGSFYTLRGTMYKGEKVYCPVCEESFSKFIDNQNCPKCGSAQRHRLLYLYLKNRTNFFTQPLKVLHFAPEHCFYKRFSGMTNLEYYSADLNSPRAMLKVDMTNMTFSDNHFDVVISSHVLEHIPNDHQAMTELFRVMKPTGWAIHQVPIDYSRKHTYENPAIDTNEDRLKHFGHIDHKRIYGRDYKTRLESAGFKVLADSYSNSLSSNQRDRFVIDPTELVYFCRKRLT